MFVHLGPILTLWFLALTLLSAGQPDGYYDSAEGLEGEELREALSIIISGHNAQSYGSLWEHFELTDKKSDGTVWDVYSDTPGTFPPYVYQFVSDQCGSYTQEGDCYNREHSVPSSWFDSAAPAYTDLFHLYPVDGYVNGMRSDHPYGPVSNPTYTSQNGGKRGPCVFPGYSGTAFEPIDDFKGDLARTYFYMATRYKSTLSAWNSSMFSQGNLSPWAAEMLLQWAATDPVDDKETARNEAVYLIQNNRNPYIDRPVFAEEVWDIEGKNPDTVAEKDNSIELYVSEGLLIHPQFDATAQLLVFDITGRLRFQTSCDAFQTILPSIQHPGLFIIRIENSHQIGLLKWMVQ